MKQLILVFLLLGFVFFFSACKKQKSLAEEAKETNKGVISAKLNGASWEPQVVSAYFDHRDANTYGMWCEILVGNMSAQNLGFSGIPYMSGTTEIKQSISSGNSVFPTAAFSLMEYDAVLCGFHVLNADSIKNYVKVDRYEEKQGIVTGSFQLTMYQADGKDILNWPDTLQFTDGYFSVRIKD